MNRVQVLIADDENDWVAMIEVAFQARGLVCASCRSLNDVPNALDDLGPVDLLLINASLMSSFMDLDSVRSGVSKIAVISNEHVLSLAIEAFHHNMDYADKAFDQATLEKLVTRLIEPLPRPREFRAPQTAVNYVKLLVADDSAEWRAILCAALDNIPRLRASSVSSYAEALDALSKDEYQIIVADLRLLDEDPYNVDGLILLKNIRDADAGISVILTSGYATLDLVREAMLRYGASDFLLKNPDPNPFTLNAYRRAVLRAANNYTVIANIAAG
jgi:DNA-binding NtrC family response regulator